MADLTATATDTLGGVDALAPVYAGAVAQPVAELRDALAVTHGSSIAGGTLGLTDTVDVDFTLGIIIRDLTDTLAMSDAGGDQNIDDELATLLAASDTPSRTSTYVRTHTDTLGATDEASQGVNHVRTASSTLGALDDVAVVQEHAASITDQLGATDTHEADKQGIGQQASDNLGATDATIASIGRNKTASDTLGLTDAHTVELGRGVTDTLGATDQANRQQDHAPHLTDTISAQGAIDTEAAGAATRATVDRSNLSDDVTVTHIKVIELELGDSLSVTSLALPAIGYAVTVEDNLGSTDLATDGQSTAHARTITDQLELDDTIGLGFTPARNITRSVTDQVGPSDTLTFDAAHTLTDSLGATDILNVSVYSLEATITDTLGGTDQTTTDLYYTRRAGTRTVTITRPARTITVSRPARIVEVE